LRSRGDDLALLRDDDLRTLVGRLCEEEVRNLGLATSTITWGGDQDATDGGLDVRAELPKGIGIAGFLPRAATGLQVKKSDMSGTKILNEMRPPSNKRGTVKRRGTKERIKKQQRNKLRPVIAELAAVGGAYIIVSAKGSTTDTALRNRRGSMRSALGQRQRKLLVDFYDRGRLATWLREHPGLIPWVRSRIGKTIAGWQSYGACALSPQGTEDAYCSMRNSASKPVPAMAPSDVRRRRGYTSFGSCCANRRASCAWLDFLVSERRAWSKRSSMTVSAKMPLHLRSLSTRTSLIDQSGLR
jgi:hypothetical protein